MIPNFGEEKKLWKRGYKRVVGLDEAGRGPLAGPVVAAAVMINLKLKFKIKKLDFKIIRDSKRLSQKQREAWYQVLTRHPAIEWGVGRVSEKIIDRINIKNAAELAMEKALEKLRTKNSKNGIDFLIIDGNHIKNEALKKINHKLIVKADEKIFSCQAASILAKVARDRIMAHFHKKYPKYGFDRHKGYPTEEHIKNLKIYGPCAIHRKSFRPVIKSQTSKLRTGNSG